MKTLLLFGLLLFIITSAQSQDFLACDNFLKAENEVDFCPTFSSTESSTARDCKQDPYHIFSLFGFLSSTVNLIVNIVNNNNSNNNNNK